MNPLYEHPNHHINLLLPAQIDYRGRTFSATLGSLTPEGALLETRGLTLPSGMEVELSLTLGPNSWQVQAVVSHTTPHEIGVMFKRTQHQLYAAAHEQLPLRFQPKPRVVAGLFARR